MDTKYDYFTGTRQFNQLVNTLKGFLEGISIDHYISSDEIAALRLWLDDNKRHFHKHPFSEFLPILVTAMNHGAIEGEDIDNLLWLCDQLKSSEYENTIKNDLQTFHAILGGIAADREISILELKGLGEWLNEHKNLQKCWPYDDIYEMSNRILADGKIDQQEHQELLFFCNEFMAMLDDRTINSPIVMNNKSETINVFQENPKIIFKNKRFCFTGESLLMTRAEFENEVVKLGGTKGGLASTTDYLIVGSEGNPAWKYSKYGDKIEKAINLKKKGSSIQIIHERAFHDALAKLQHS